MGGVSSSPGEPEIHATFGQHVSEAPLDGLGSPTLTQATPEVQGSGWLVTLSLGGGG